ncbi:hypothetical protein OOK31_26560 [Streptomyces sp. NBC_00249]|uniref:hypothetical protein n=1 Tax=Streptomyces sp. NBC_00249 TaxID=2975690 RepID=UPI00225405BF|nr:hypothetical protein [Streptomyces sp. NBC_00249]MCX5197415.1 hypothetical protein [Streptomyces sp. NBC_00249]
MSAIVVVYEVDRPPGVASHGAEGTVLRVHAAPAAPGSTSARGPRTFCGKDTFAMDTASWTPDGQPGFPWYPLEHASRVCPACDEAVA